MSNALNLLFQGTPNIAGQDLSKAGSSPNPGLGDNAVGAEAGGNGQDSFAQLLENTSTQPADSAAADEPVAIPTQNTLDSGVQKTPTIVLDKLSKALSSNLFFNAAPELDSSQDSPGLNLYAGMDLPATGKDLPPKAELSAEAKAHLDRAINKLFGITTDKPSQSATEIIENTTDELPLDSPTPLPGPTETTLLLEPVTDPIFEGLAFLPEEASKPLQNMAKNPQQNDLNEEEPLLQFERAGPALVTPTVDLKQIQLNEKIISADKEQTVTTAQRFNLVNNRGEGSDMARNRAEPVPEYTVERIQPVETARPISNAVNTVMTNLAATTDTAGVSSNESSVHTAVLQSAGSGSVRPESSNELLEGQRANTQARVSVPLNQPGWNENLGRQLTLLVSRNFESAQIHLEPPELGPLQVRFQIQNDQVALQFVSQHAVVRDAVEQTLARLQELFNEEGLDLVDVDITDKDTQENDQGNNSDENSLAEGDESDDILTQQVSLSLDDGKIDYFI